MRKERLKFFLLFILSYCFATHSAFAGQIKGKGYVIMQNGDSLAGEISILKGYFKSIGFKQGDGPTRSIGVREIKKFKISERIYRRIYIGNAYAFGLRIFDDEGVEVYSTSIVEGMPGVSLPIATKQTTYWLFDSRNARVVQYGFDNKLK